MIESLCNGAFTSQTANDPSVFFEDVAENTLEWKLVSTDVKQLTTTTTTPNKGDVHRVNHNFDNDANMAVRRLEALEMSK